MEAKILVPDIEPDAVEEPEEVAMADMLELTILVAQWDCPKCKTRTQLTDPLAVKMLVDGKKIVGNCKQCDYNHKVLKSMISVRHKGPNRHARRAMRS